MKKQNFLYRTIKSFINENTAINKALDKIKKVGGFKNLPEIDKLALLNGSDREDELKKLDLLEIYNENGGTFGKFLIRVKIKPLNELTGGNKMRVRKYAGKTGWLYPHYNFNDDLKKFVGVRLEDFKISNDMTSDGYETVQVYFEDIFPIGYNGEISKFFDRGDNFANWERESNQKGFDYLFDNDNDGNDNNNFPYDKYDDMEDFDGDD